MEDKDTELESWMKLGMMASNHTIKGAARWTAQKADV